MLKKLMAALFRGAAIIVAAVWRKEGDKLSIDISRLLVLPNGKAVSVADIKSAAQVVAQIYEGRANGQTTAQIEAAIAPALETIAADAINLFVPGFGGLAVGLVEFVIKDSIPFGQLPQEQQNAIMDRQGGTSQNF
jgi:hypothetical protein